MSNLKTPSESVQPPASPTTSGNVVNKPLSFNQIEHDDPVEAPEESTDVLNEPSEKEDLDAEFNEDEDTEEGLEDEAEDEAEGDEDGGEEDESDDEPESDQEEKSDDILNDEDLEKKLKVKIDGKWETKSLKEWRNVIASGAHNLKTFRAWEDRKAQEVKLIQEKAKEIGNANAKISPAWDKLKKNDVEGTIYELASSRGMNRLDVARRLREQMLPAIAQRLGLSEQDVRQRLTQMANYNQTLDIQEENEFLKSERARQAEANKSQGPDPVAVEERNIQAMMIENGFSRSDIKFAYEWLVERTPQGMQPNFTVDTLKEVITNRRFVMKAFDAIESRRPSLVEDEKFVDRTVRKLKNNPDWSIARLAAWVDKQARKAADGKKKQQVDELTRDVSRKALKGKGKDGFANPDVAQKRAFRFNDLIKDDQSGDNLG